MRSGSRLFGTLTFLLAIALFVATVRQAGIKEILARVSSMGAGFIVVLLIAGLRVALRSSAWFISLTTNERRVGFAALFKARLIGDAIGHLTPAGPLVGEPARLAAVGRGLPLATRLHSLAVETITYSLSSCLMVLAGTVAMLGSVALSQRLRFAGILASITMLLVMAASILVLLRRWAILSAVGEWARRGLHMIGFSRRWKRQVAHLRTFENHVFQFYRQRHGDFTKVAACEVAFHLLGVVETWMTLLLLGFETSVGAAFILEATNRAVNIVFAFVPARVGVDEISTGLLTRALGLGVSAGVIVAIVRKARVLFWTAVGLILFAVKRYES